MTEFIIAIIIVGLIAIFDIGGKSSKNREDLAEFLTYEKKNNLKKISKMAGIPDTIFEKNLEYWELNYEFTEGLPTSAVYFFNYPTDKFGYYDFESESIGTIPLSDINNVEIVKEYSYSSITKTQNGIKRAVVGGVLAGGAGAVVGAATANKETIGTQQLDRIYLKLNTNDIKHSTYIFNFIYERDAQEMEGIIIALKNKYGNIKTK